VSFWNGGQIFSDGSFITISLYKICWNGQLTAGCREVRGCTMINSNLFLRLRQSQA